MALTKTILCNMALSKLGSSRVQLSSFDNDSGELKTACVLHYEPTLKEVARMHSWNCCKKRNELSPYRLKLTPPTGAGTQTYIATGVTDSTQITNTLYTNYAKYDFNGGYTFAVSDSGDGSTLSRLNTTTGINDEKWNLKYFDSSATFNMNSAITNSFDPSGDYEFQSGQNFVVEKVKPDFEYDYQYLIPSDAIRSFYLTNSSETYKFMKPRVDWVIEGNSILTNESKVYLCYDGVPEPTAMDSLFAQAFATLLASRLCMTVTGDRNLYLSLLNEFNNVIMPEARRINGTEKQTLPVIDSEWIEASYTPYSMHEGFSPFSQASYGSF
jgi:hypothetical protein